MTNATKRRLAATVVTPVVTGLQATYCHHDYTNYALAAHEARCRPPKATIAELRVGGRKTRTDWPVVEEA